MSPEPLVRTVRPPLPVDLRLTLAPLRHGPGDPTWRIDPQGSWWHATRTPEGPATMRLSPAGDGVRIEAWGRGAERALADGPDLLGARDSLEGFDPPPGPVRELHRRMPGLRVPRSGRLLETAVPVVLAQKVPAEEALAAYRALVRAVGEPAPGPMPLLLLLPPAPDALAALPSFRYHRAGIEARRAATIRGLAMRADRLEEAARMPIADASQRLRAFPGIGPWTAARVAYAALGDADAVPVGDFHLPHAVAWLLAGRPRGDDDLMLELLAPFAGHRGRVLRLLIAAGIRAPRFGPGMPLRRIAGL
ncbi:MAG TPA: DNA-3-methyladenine glycosylase 2 family protein [Actinomycetota bacterium]|nr:DNA-3-methyladenine glycosylase 2 family protein [Actinomycetota bacterium]